MKKLYYTNDGWVCNRQPYMIPVEDSELYIEVSDDVYYDTMFAQQGMAWRIVRKKLVQEIYNKDDYQRGKIRQEIYELKQEIIKAKEDVEQVELFHMERTDYERKKARCVEIVLRLRELEARLKELSKEGE